MTDACTLHLKCCYAFVILPKSMCTCMSFASRSLLCLHSIFYALMICIYVVGFALFQASKKRYYYLKQQKDLTYYLEFCKDDKKGDVKGCIFLDSAVSVCKVRRHTAVVVLRSTRTNATMCMKTYLYCDNNHSVSMYVGCAYLLSCNLVQCTCTCICVEM